MGAIETFAEMMKIAAITAPKTRGQNYVVVKTLVGEDLTRLHDWMVQYAQAQDIPGFARDGKNVLDSGAVILIGLKDVRMPPWLIYIAPLVALRPVWKSTLSRASFKDRSARCASWIWASPWVRPSRPPA